MRFQTILALATAALCWLSPMAAGAHGHGGGGGGHVTYVPVYIPGRAIVGVAPGSTESVKFDMLPGAVEGAEGLLAPGSVIGVRRLRAAEAIVLTQPVKTDKIEIPVGTVLVRVVSTKPQAGALIKNTWCAVRTYAAFHPALTDCLQDVDGKGELVVAVSGYLDNKHAPMSISSVSLPQSTLVQPAAAYRPATTDELPTVEIGYRFCGEGDGARIPWRFTTAMLGADGTWAKSFNPSCPFGEWPNADDKAVEQVDALKVKFTTGPDGAHYQVLNEIAAGPLGGIRLGEPIQAPGSLSRQAKQEIESHTGPGLVPVGAPVVKSGLVKHAGVIAQNEVVHGITGVLKNDVRSKNWLAPRTVSAGTYVFGVPTNLQYSASRALVWCAVEMKDNDPAKPLTTCFPPVGQTTAFEVKGNILWYTSSQIVLPVIEAIGLDVERRPMKYPAPMQMTYVFDRWVLEDAGGGQHELRALLGLEIQVNGVTTPIQKTMVRPRGGAYRLIFNGAAMSLTPLDKKGQPVALSATSGPFESMNIIYQEIDDGTVQVSSAPPPLQIPTPVNRAKVSPPLIKPWNTQALPGAPQALPPPLPISPSPSSTLPIAPAVP